MTDNRGRNQNPNAAENLDEEARKRGQNDQQGSTGISSENADDEM